MMVNHHKGFDARKETLTSNSVALNPIKNEPSRRINMHSRIFTYQENVKFRRTHAKKLAVEPHVIMALTVMG
jgi:hypothetical protein